MKISYSSQFDYIKIVLDQCAEDWHIDAGPDYSSSQMKALLGRVYGMGYEAMSADECEPEILPDGSVRIYLVPVSV